MSDYLRMEVSYIIKILIENGAKNYKQTCRKQKIAKRLICERMSQIHTASGRENLNTRDRGIMCWAGPRWRPNRDICMAYGTVTRTCTVHE